jgi:hypothetical protein
MSRSVLRLLLDMPLTVLVPFWISGISSLSPLLLFSRLEYHLFFIKSYAWFDFSLIHKVIGLCYTIYRTL